LTKLNLSGNQKSDAAEFEDCLGKEEDTPEVLALLAKLGIKKKLKPSDEGYARLKLPTKGLLLSFEPIDEKSSKLKFSGVQFYSDSEEGFTTFAGALPKGLTFSDSPKEARQKLGKPTKIMKEFRLDHWIAKGRQLTVRYRRTMDGIAYVLSGFPRKD
jgi:hypothetical protein